MYRSILRVEMLSSTSIPCPAAYFLFLLFGGGLAGGGLTPRPPDQPSIHPAPFLALKLSSPTPRRKKKVVFHSFLDPPPINSSATPIPFTPHPNSTALPGSARPDRTACQTATKLPSPTSHISPPLLLYATYNRYSSLVSAAPISSFFYL
jgi:hypothetical protein